MRVSEFSERHEKSTKRRWLINYALKKLKLENLRIF